NMELYSVIKKDHEYWLVDQVKQEEVANTRYVQKFENLLEEWRESHCKYLSLLMDQKNEAWLLGQGFHKVSSIVEYTCLLNSDFKGEAGIEIESLSQSGMDDADFAKLYERCRSGSANKNNLFTMKQIMESLENELGNNWRSNCNIFKKDGQPIGISIPVIENGTDDEGRLFYFGVVPEKRGKGFGTTFHRLSLGLLKNMNATYYVGSTDENNVHMFHIFERNGCELRDKKGIYRINQE
ncbi:MAG TPA: GNAT family N-acetyltransferase, partial [Paenisporosarcina sp.]|nr:GNAT family N-acetyltransferase [Paenisporosarcina sp.]